MLRSKARDLWTSLQPLAGLICPPECVWCAVPTGLCERNEPSNREERLCHGCRTRLLSDYYRCQKCATAIPSVVPNQDCYRCRDAGWRFDRVLTLGPYRNDLRCAVILMKKPGQELLRQVLGELMAQLAIDAVYCSDTAALPPLLIPVPNHWTHRFRGVSDSAGTLAKAVSKHTGWPLNSTSVRRIRKTAKQGMLAWSERSQNVRGAFKILAADRVTGRHVILVDDVFTSGATAAELSSRLKRAGAAEVTVLVAARGTGARESSDPTPIPAEKNAPAGP